MLDMVVLVFSDWKDRFRWGFSEEEFPGKPNYLLFIILVGVVSQGGLGLFATRLEVGIWVAAFLCYLYFEHTFQLAYGNRLHPVHFMVPIKREELRKYLLTNFFLKWVVLQLGVTLLLIPLGAMISDKIFMVVMLWLQHGIVQLELGIRRGKGREEFAYVSHRVVVFMYYIFVSWAMTELLEKMNTGSYVIGIATTIIMLLALLRILYLEFPQNFNWVCKEEK